jgi:hypothetical protein
MSDGRIALSDDLQYRWFVQAMNTLNRNKRDLSSYDLELYRKMRDGYDFSKRELTITVKQMNHLKQVAAEIEGGTYRG